MENLHTLPISMESEALAALKSDMDSLITQTISSMQAWKNNEGTMTVKLTIKLTEDLADDGKGGMRPVVVPRFEHKVSAVLQAKAERKGSTTDDYELIWDDDANQYVMVKSRSNQESMFDEDGNPFDYKVFGGFLNGDTPEDEEDNFEDDDVLPGDDDDDELPFTDEGDADDETA